MTILGMYGLDEFNAEFARARATEEDEAIMISNPPLLDMADRCLIGIKQLQVLERLVDQKPGWWRWLLNHYYHNRLANFVVRRWPGISEIVAIYHSWISIQLDLKFMGLHNSEKCVSLIESVIGSDDD